MEGKGCIIKAGVIIAVIIAAVAIIYLGGALTYPLIPAAVDVTTGGRVQADEQMLFMVNPATVISVLGILVVAAVIAIALGGMGKR